VRELHCACGNRLVADDDEELVQQVLDHAPTRCTPRWTSAKDRRGRWSPPRLPTRRTPRTNRGEPYRGPGIARQETGAARDKDKIQAEKTRREERKALRGRRKQAREEMLRLKAELGEAEK